MPNPNLSDEDISDVIAFLTWVSNIDNQNWPPRPDCRERGHAPGHHRSAPRLPAAASSDPIALGEALFRQSPPACFSCHSTPAGRAARGPSLAGVARARRDDPRQSPGYTGTRTDARGVHPRVDPASERLRGPGPDVLGGRAVDHARGLRRRCSSQIRSITSSLTWRRSSEEDLPDALPDTNRRLSVFRRGDAALRPADGLRAPRGGEVPRARSDQGLAAVRRRQRPSTPTC